MKECSYVFEGKYSEDMLQNCKILSFACKDRKTAVPAGFVAVEGYLKTKGSTQVKRVTLWRRWRHPDLTIEWTAIRIGKEHRYIDYDWIQICGAASQQSQPAAGECSL